MIRAQASGRACVCRRIRRARYGEGTMSWLRSRQWIAAGSALACIAALSAKVAAQSNSAPPDFSSDQAAWLHPPGGDFPAVPGSPMPMRQDPAHPFVGNNTGAQPTYRIADLSNPNLKQWAKD